MEDLTHRECCMCGWIGHREEEVTVDLGYSQRVDTCPKCASDDLTRITAEEAEKILASYA